jgi:hypothetical protein
MAFSQLFEEMMAVEFILFCHYGRLLLLWQGTS